MSFSVSLCGPLPLLELTLRRDKLGISKHCNLPLNYFYQKSMSWCGYFNLHYINNSTVIKEPPKYIARTVRKKAVLENIYREHTSQAGQVRSEREPVKWGCGRRMRTADNYKIRKIRKDRSFSSFNLRTIACNLYPCGLVLIQKWQVPKHLDLKGRLMSGTLCKTNLGLRVLKRRPLATLLMPCYRPKFLVALNKSVLVLG